MGYGVKYMLIPFEDITNSDSQEFLHINSCGIGKYPTEFTVYRPNGRLDMHFLYIAEGTATVNIDDEDFELSTGQMVVFFKNDKQYYKFLPENNTPVKSYWIHFCGSAAEGILLRAGICKSQMLEPISSTETEHLFSAIIKQHFKKEDLSALGNLLRLIDLITKKPQKKLSDTERRIRREAEYISENFASSINFDDMARRCYISRTRFTHLFTTLIGAPPLKLQTSYRIEHAKELLRYTDISISEIATMCGFNDALYFSRTFSKYLKKSPSEYRKSKRERR